MKKIIILTFSFLLLTSNSFAFWMWTPETNKWVNPKFAVKETPSEQLDYALGLYESQEYEGATHEFKKLIKNYPKSREAPDAQFYIAKILENNEEYYDAFQAYQLVIDTYPFSDRSAEIIKIQYDIGLKFLKGEGKRTGIIAALSISEYDVVEVFKTIIKNAPYGELAPVAQYKIGLYLLEKGLYQEARDEFERVLNNYPESEWAKAAKYQIAVSDAKRSTAAAYDQKITQAAIEEFKEFVEVYPEAELSREAKGEIAKLRDKEAENAFLVAQYYEKTKNYKAAKIYFQSVVNDYSQTIWASKALSRIQEIGQKE